MAGRWEGGSVWLRSERGRLRGSSGEEEEAARAERVAPAPCLCRRPLSDLAGLRGGGSPSFFKKRLWLEEGSHVRLLPHAPGWEGGVSFPIDRLRPMKWQCCGRAGRGAVIQWAFQECRESASSTNGAVGGRAGPYTHSGVHALASPLLWA